MSSEEQKILTQRMMGLQYQLDGFTNNMLSDLDNVYQQTTQRILNDLDRVKDKAKWTKDRLLSTLEIVGAQQEALIGKMEGYLTDGLVTAGKYSYDTMNKIVSWDGMVEDFTAFPMSRAQLYNLVTEQRLGDKTLTEWVASAVDAESMGAVKSAVQTGYTRGTGYDKMMRELKNVLGVEKGTKQARDLETVVKSYVQAINGKAQQDVYEVNKIVNGVEWSAIMENGNKATGRGTCPRCIALDGQIWAKDDYKRPPMPLHLRCRCMFLPVTPSWKALGVDIDEMKKAKSPAVIRDNKGTIIKHDSAYNYSDWFAKQSVEFQNRAIGPKRAALYREGAIKLKNLVDSRGNLIPIKDLSTVTAKRRKKPPTPASIITTVGATVVKAEAGAAPAPMLTVDRKAFDPVFSGEASLMKKQYYQELDKMTQTQIGIVNHLPPPFDITIDGDKGYFSSYERRIAIRPDRRGGQGVRHEYGHYVDQRLQEKLVNAIQEESQMFSSSSGQWVKVDKALKEDFKNLGLDVMDVGSTQYDNAVKNLSERFIVDSYAGPYLAGRTADVNTYGLQDLLDSVTWGVASSRHGIAGHGQRYFGSDYARNNENFGNLWELRSDEANWSTVKQMFPKAAAAYDELLEDVLTRLNLGATLI